MTDDRRDDRKDNNKERKEETPDVRWNEQRPSSVRSDRGENCLYTKKGLARIYIDYGWLVPRQMGPQSVNTAALTVITAVTARNGTMVGSDTGALLTAKAP